MRRLLCATLVEAEEGCSEASRLSQLTSQPAMRIATAGSAGKNVVLLAR